MAMLVYQRVVADGGFFVGKNCKSRADDRNGHLERPSKVPILEGEILIDADAEFSRQINGCFRGKNWDVCSKELLKKEFVVKV